MRRAAEAAALALLLGGCAASDARFAEAQRSELAEEIAGRIAGAPVDCVPERAALRITGGALIAVEGGRLWANDNDRRCAGATIDPLVIAEPLTGSRLCRNDRFRTLPRGSSIAGPICRVGAWVPYTTP